MESFVSLVKDIGWAGAILVFLAVMVVRWGYNIGMFLKEKLFSEERGDDGKAKGIITKTANSHVSLINSLERGLELLINQEKETHDALVQFADATKQSVAAIDKSVDAIRETLEGQRRLEAQREQQLTLPPISGIMVDPGRQSHKHTSLREDPESVL